jgi:hypothetical protein
MLLMSLSTLLELDLQVLMCCPKPLPLVITASSAKVGSSQGNTWGVTTLVHFLSLKDVDQWRTDSNYPKHCLQCTMCSMCPN